MPDTPDSPAAKVPPPALAQVPPDPTPLIPRAPGQARVTRQARGRRPLPDAQAIVEVDLPALAPPYDDTAAARIRSGRSRRLTLVDPVPDSRPRVTRAPQESNREVVPAAGSWPSQFAQVLAETLAGARPAEQLAPWTTQQARRKISQLGPMLASGPQPRVRRVIVTSPAAGVLEMTAIIVAGSAVHAIAIRLERPASPAAPASAPVPGSPAAPGSAPVPGSPGAPGSAPAPGSPTALTAAAASRRAARLRANASWLCTAVEVA